MSDQTSMRNSAMARQRNAEPQPGNPFVRDIVAQMSIGQGQIAGSAGFLALLAACGGAATPEVKGGDDGRVAPVNDARDQPCARERARAAELAQRAEAVTPPE